MEKAFRGIMSESEVIEIFNKIASEEKCPECGQTLTGGYYDPEALVKGPSDGVIAIKVTIEDVLEDEARYASSLALYVECREFGRGCRFREPFYRFYKKNKKGKKQKG